MCIKLQTLGLCGEVGDVRRAEDFVEIGFWLDCDLVLTSYKLVLFILASYALINLREPRKYKNLFSTNIIQN